MTITVDERTLSTSARMLLAAKRNVYSQCGEDGIIDAILSMLTTHNQWCVEFGAWDGSYLSNTRRLIDELDYSAVMIEADSISFSKLKEAFKSNNKVTCLQAYVGYDQKNNLDTLLSATSCPIDFDVLSIDIDGNDIHVWNAIQEFRPKVVVIEFNPTIPTAVEFAQPRDPGIKWGSSLRALFELGCQKRYRLVCANVFNAFFVAEELWGEDYCQSIEDLTRFRGEEPEPVYVFSGFDGSIHLSAECYLQWHEMRIREKDMQVLPKYLRRYPLDYSCLQRQIFRILSRLRRAQ
jgi:hypothetical protein